MKQTYIFILGRNAALSIAEIKSVLNFSNWDFEVVLQTREVLLIDSASLDYKQLNKTLGGTVKIGVVLGVSSEKKLDEFLSFDFLTTNVFAQIKSKIQFGMSVYDGGDRNLLENVSRQINRLSKTIKNGLSEYDLSVRFAYQTDRFLSSVVVSKNKLLEKGAEIIFIPTLEGIIIGKTLCVQEFEEFSARDYGRPVRDMKSGVMPPKLARMMINLAQIPHEAVLLDPFCGSATMLQEAAILGYKHIYGRDVSQKAVVDSLDNTNWLLSKNPDIKAEIDIKKCDVADLSQNIKKKVDAIISEPYLGPTLHQELPRPEFEKVQKELEKLYITAFSEFKKILEKNGVVVFILPVFQRKRQKVYLDILPRIEKIGFEKIKLDMSPRGSITVGNKYDFVLREVVKLKKS